MEMPVTGPLSSDELEKQLDHSHVIIPKGKDARFGTGLILEGSKLDYNFCQLSNKLF